ncbi:MAG TPA: IS3 family transposase [Kofleriaceae bacterium]|nr:IS3 family transposase [Kofleriaceae bacterium]
MKFDFIAAENADRRFDVKFMCRELGVSTSGYYDYQKRGISKREREDLALVPMIHAEFRKHPRGCGSRMVLGGLRAQGCTTSRKRVVRLMAEENLRHRLKRRFVRTTQSKHERPVAPNVLEQSFEVGEPNKVWASDITYVYTRCGWAYLAAVLDLGSRKVVGWRVEPTMEESLVLGALRRALEQRDPPPGLIHHSDRGSQYAARAYQQLLAEYDIVCSMSRRANCWDNACVESFFSTLKRELPNDHVFEDWREVERAVFAYVDAHYNTRRPHSALGYRTPNEYEELQAAA